MVKVLLAGAGIGGLAAALAMLRLDIDCEIHEQSAELGDVGAGIMLTPNATRVLTALGLAEELHLVASEPEASIYRRFDSGEVLLDAPLRGAMEQRHGARYFHVHRADLHRMLSVAVRRLKPDAIHLGAALLSYAIDGDRVEARFGNGKTATGRGLVGCDGARSTVRELTFGGTAPTFTGQVAWRGLVPAAGLPPSLTRPGSTVWIGQDRHLIHYALRGGCVVNYVAVVATAAWQEESWTRPSEVGEAIAHFGGFHPDVIRLLESTDSRQCFKWGLFDRNPLPGWTRGPVTLLGDAAHPMLPFMAQGAAMSMEDGLVLARALQASASVTEGFARYEAVRRPRTSAVVVQSRAATRLYQQLSGDKQEARNSHLDALYGYDAAGVTV